MSTNHTPTPWSLDTTEKRFILREPTDSTGSKDAIGAFESPDDAAYAIACANVQDDLVDFVREIAENVARPNDTGSGYYADDGKWYPNMHNLATYEGEQAAKELLAKLGLPPVPEPPPLPEVRWPIEDWKYEVTNCDTKLGYAEWLQHKIEAERGVQ